MDEAPLYIDLLLGAIYVLLAAIVLLTGWSLVRSIRLRGKDGIRSMRTAAAMVLLLVACLVVTWLLGSTRPLTINGTLYTDTFWLRLSDMLINTSLVLIMVAVGAVAFGYSGLIRKFKK